MTTPAAFIGLDVETTGLDPDTDVILEIGVVILDEHFQPLDSRSWTTGSREILASRLADMDPLVWRMHIDSGLMAEIGDLGPLDNSMRVKRRGAILREIMHFIWEASGRSPLPLVGSSIHFDREMLRRDSQWRGILDVVSHQNVDATSVVKAHMAFIPEGDRPGESRSIEAEQARIRDEWVRRLPQALPAVPHRTIFDVLGSAALIRAVHHHAAGD